MVKVGFGSASDVRMTVDRHLGDIAQQLLGTIASLAEFEQLRRGIDEAGGQRAVEELLMIDHILDELQITRDTANPEFTQASVHALDRFGGSRRPGSHLDQQ